MFTSTNKPLSNLPAASIGLNTDATYGADLSLPGTQAPRSLADIVLELIWRERRISRADIARRTKLARSTVSDIVRKLLQSGLVAEVGMEPSSGGRRPVVLEFQDDAFEILGVDFGATHISVTLTDLRGKVLEWKERERPVDGDVEASRSAVMELCDECMGRNGNGTRRLLGIGVAVPSPVDPRHLQRISDVVLPSWRGRIGLENLHRRYGVPILVDNDANLGALAEGWWGAGRDVRDFTYIKVATGIGAGIILGGEIYRGSTGVAGEIGHMTVDPKGDPCVCGLRGCLATFIGTDALLARARALRSLYQQTALSSEEMTILQLADAARAGDPLAAKVVSEAAEHLGIAIAGLLNVMNPAMIILGGSLTRAGDLLLERLRSIVRERTYVTSVAATEICIGELGPSAVAIGASTLVLNAAFADPTLFSSPRYHQVRI